VESCKIGKRKMCKNIMNYGIILLITLKMSIIYTVIYIIYKLLYKAKKDIPHNYADNKIRNLFNKIPCKTYSIIS